MTDSPYDAWDAGYDFGSKDTLKTMRDLGASSAWSTPNPYMSEPDANEMSDKEALDRIALILKVTNEAQVGLSEFGVKVLSEIVHNTGRTVR